MEVTALCFRLVMLELIFLREQVHNSYTQNRAFLRITPNRLQHFQFNSVSFDCVGFDGRTHLKGNSKEFNQTFSSRKTTSSFTIDRVYPGDSGEYWCESEGERSDGVNITITAGPVILNSPALPVMQGTNVILHCRSNNQSTNLIIFYKNNVLMHNSSVEEIEIKNVSKSDEGFYRCYVFSLGTSPASWLAVRENIISITSYPPNEETTLLKDTSDYIVFIILRVLSLVVLLLVVGFFYFKKPKVSYFGPVNGVEVQMNQMA
ncbi:high affinity immunoglobulin gamma Fc receptor I-like [Anabas testudineus]|uniref:high affinity immunoglobulin gamma Fc receptor I-like n=1 Tax=Anabas testudineus TaxID=64144 RepID=UPI000E461EA2|nr:high affinity immunoglobulin gamma Fc receptor I-like [Anabas testudineus]